MLLTTFLTPLAILGSWSITKHVREYMIFLLLLETGMLGVFLALDLFLFYVFWEVMLIPMYFLIGVWGGQNRIYAAVKFFLYTMAGSLLMLVGILALYFWHGDATGNFTFSYVQILQSMEDGQFLLPANLQLLLFLAFALAFAIKVPLFPFHTWLPDAHVEAPTAGSVILAGVLLKMGTYGLLRFACRCSPTRRCSRAPYVSVLAVIGIIYGALVSMVQPDLKKLVAYSSVSHLGFVVLGIFAFNIHGVQGATYQMLNHGISTGGALPPGGHDLRAPAHPADRRFRRPRPADARLRHLLPDRHPVLHRPARPERLRRRVPGAAGRLLRHRTFGVLAALGMILSAWYMLWMYQRVFLGPADRTPPRLTGPGPPGKAHPDPAGPDDGVDGRLFRSPSSAPWTPAWKSPRPRPPGAAAGLRDQGSRPAPAGNPDRRRPGRRAGPALARPGVVRERTLLPRHPARRSCSAPAASWSWWWSRS